MAGFGPWRRHIDHRVIGLGLWSMRVTLGHGFFLSTFVFLCQLSSQQCSVFIHQLFMERTMGRLATIVPQRGSVTPPQYDKEMNIFFMFEFPCIISLYYIRNQQDATLAVLFISNCKITLHSLRPSSGVLKTVVAVTGACHGLG